MPRAGSISSDVEGGDVGNDPDSDSSAAACSSDPVSPYDPTHAAALAASSARYSLPSIGTVIGKYELIRELGRGGMGTVFLARDTKLGRRVAIKFLHSNDAALNVRFVLEARATAQFQHENIIVIYEVDEYADLPFMVLEYLQGGPLSTLLRKGRSLRPRKAVDIMIAVARALERAHECGIVHRDLKPDNIFLTDAGTIKVLDFGIAKVMQERDPQARGGSRSALADMLALLDRHEARAQADSTGPPPESSLGGPGLTEHGAILGTLPYMSPEQWGAGSVDPRSDIWACGVLLFRMLVGRHPLHPAKGSQLAITAALEHPMPRVRQVTEVVPDELADIIDRCLIKDKERRLGSATELLRALEALTPGARPGSSRADQTPYAGLCSFQESDAGKFFGRAQEITAAAARLQKQPLMAVIGPSGVGKSSFVRAGLMPALKQSGESWATLVVRPGREPVSALAQVIAPLVPSEDEGSSTTVAKDLAEIEVVRRRLYQEPGYMGVVLRHRAHKKGHKMLVFVDQFEELYTLVSDPRERSVFTRCLASVADDPTSPLRVVISLRPDFLDRVPEDRHFMSELAQSLFFLTPPGRSGLCDALIQPAEMVGFQFETEAMVEHMLDHLEHTPGALPLLQFAATKLWELRDQKKRLLTRHSYDQIGGIAGALASHADSVLAELSPGSQELARAVFLRLITPERTRAIVTTSELRELSSDPDEVQHLLDHLVQARLLIVSTEDGNGAATVEIVHESLIQSWPLLRKWLEENQDDAAFLEQLRHAAKQWQAKGYPQGLLWRGEAMEEARLWRRRYHGDLPGLQERYLQAVFALANRAGRRKRILLIAFAVLMTALASAAAVALVIIRDAQQEATRQAAAATHAEKQLREQIAVVQQARKDAERANEELRAAIIQADDARTNAERANRELQIALAQAEAARARAETAERRARLDRQIARQKEREARAAENKAKAAQTLLAAQLEKEKERVEELRKAGTTNAITDIEIHE